MKDILLSTQRKIAFEKTKPFRTQCKWTLACISTRPGERPKSRQVCKRKDASGNLGPVKELSLIHPEVFHLQLFRKPLLLILPYSKAELNLSPGKTAEKVLTECCSGHPPDVPQRMILLRSNGV